MQSIAAAVFRYAQHAAQQRHTVRTLLLRLTSLSCLAYITLRFAPLALPARKVSWYIIWLRVILHVHLGYSCSMVMRYSDHHRNLASVD